MTSPSPATEVRAAALNTWGRRGDWSRRQQVLRNGLAADVLPDGYHLVHSRAREDDGQGITTASRWPVGETIELDLNVTSRTGDFACTTLITEVLGPAPLSRIWLVNHFPDYQLDQASPWPPSRHESPSDGQPSG